MISASIGLAAFALALAWPVPILFSHAKWPTRAPATALAVSYTHLTLPTIYSV